MKKLLIIVICIMLVFAIAFPAAAISTTAVKSISLDMSTLTLGLHQTHDLKVTFTPADTTQKLLTYTTSNKDVATIDENGKISAKYLGKTTITVYTPNKNVYAKCNVTVSEKTVKLKIFGLVTGSYASGIQTDPIAVDIQRKLGIYMNFDFSFTLQKMQAKMASGDLDDIWITRQDLTQAQVTGKQLIPLDDLIATRGPDIIKNAPKMLQFVKDNYSYGTGKTYMLNGILDPGGNPQFQQEPFIRWDYYKEMGYPKVTNLDELADVLIAIQKKHPTTEDGKKMYAAGIYVDQVTDTIAIAGGSFFGVSGAVLSQDYNDYTKLYDIYDSKNPLMNSAKFYNKLYRAGVLDPDSATQGYANYAAKAKSSGYLCVFTVQDSVDANAAFAKAGAEKGFLPILPPDGSTTIGGWATPFGAFGKRLAITSACKYPERAMDLLNYLYSIDGARTMVSGVKGQIYDNYGGKLKLLPGISQRQYNDPNFNSQNAINKYLNMSGLLGNNKDENGQFLNLFNDPIANPTAKIELTPLVKEAAHYYGISDAKSWPDMQTKVFAKKKYKNYMVNNSLSLLLPTYPADLATINNKAMDLIKNAAVTMIMAKDDSTYDSLKAKMYADLKAIGYDSFLSWYKDANAKALAKAKELMN
jgi:putative aldouronate transport system substrate-binding protein